MSRYNGSCCCTRQRETHLLDSSMFINIFAVRFLDAPSLSDGLQSLLESCQDCYLNAEAATPFSMNDSWKTQMIRISNSNDAVSPENEKIIGVWRASIPTAGESKHNRSIKSFSRDDAQRHASNNKCLYGAIEIRCRNSRVIKMMMCPVAWLSLAPHPHHRLM